ncbi:hypothetical protein [Herbaspirillum chlorophenolicum]|uniref:hypothetical protein n=1 Tax=Herbaspirillum chlorophenolicum TaxID=211589 RepID=UPI000A456A2B|nr:hypothetical protein [Herbaspirillum chlorophenolicum]
MNPTDDTSQPDPQQATQPGELEKPADDELAKKWASRIRAARKHWEKLHKRIKHNRKKAAGFNWNKSAESRDFVDNRANLIFSTAQATLPNIYARNPDVSVTGTWRHGDVRLFCDTLQTVLSRQMRDAHLKKRMKMTVLGALIEYFGVLKVTYQRDLRTDPLIIQRINDTQDNIERLEGLMQSLDDDQQRGDAELHKRELEQVLQGLSQQSEVVAAEGLVIDRVLPENLLIDPAVIEFDDYENADWIAQVVPMTRGAAKARYKIDLSGAKSYEGFNAMDDQPDKSGSVMMSTPASKGSDDEQICILEIWDKQSQLVYTMADGTSFFCREAFSVQTVGQRWYPFFLLPYAVLPGQFIAPCLVDLTEKLQVEHNETRDKFAAHRNLNKPGWVASSDLNGKSVKRHTDAELGEVVLIDTDGKPLNQTIMARPNIPINPADYDTGPIRQDWEQVTGLQDAARSTIVQAKTATEAGIMQQALSGRTGEFRDKQEDMLTEMSQYAAEVLLQNLSPVQVARYTGPNVDAVMDQVTGQVITPARQAFDWPELTRDQIFDMVEISIVAGTTGAPDKAQAQEIWAKVMPLIQPLVTQIMQMAAQGIDYQPLEALLRETMSRLDDRIDVSQFLPKMQAPPVAPPAAPGMPGIPPGMLPAGAGAQQPVSI